MYLGEETWDVELSGENMPLSEAGRVPGVGKTEWLLPSRIMGELLG